MVAALYRIFFAEVLLAGQARWFSRNREAPATPSFGQLFSLFHSRAWLPAVGALFWKNLWLFLWSLLPLIPVAGAVAGLSSYLGRHPLQLPAGWSFGSGAFRFWSGGSQTFPGPDFHGQLGEFYQNNQPQIAWMAAVLAATLLLACCSRIPRINRYYAYRLTPWIIGDNPNIGFRGPCVSPAR